MLNTPIISTLATFFTAFSGFIFVRYNIILWLLSIEIMLFAVNMNFVWIAIYFDDLLGFVYAPLMLALIAAETSIGLLLLIHTRKKLSLQLISGQL